MRRLCKWAMILLMFLAACAGGNWAFMGWWYENVSVGVDRLDTGDCAIDVEGGFLHTAFGNQYSFRMTRPDMTATIRNAGGAPLRLKLRVENAPEGRVRFENMIATSGSRGWMDCEIGPGLIAQVRVGDPGPENYSFAVLSDVHGNLRTARDLLRQIDDAGADFIVGCGDLSIGGRLPALETLTAYVAAFSDLPLYAAPGNHDLTRDNRTDHFQRTTAPPFSVFQRGRMLFFLLDNSRNEFGDIQLQWLRTELARREATADGFVLFCHHPPVDIPELEYKWRTPRETERLNAFFTHPKFRGLFCGALHMDRTLNLGNAQLYISGGGGGRLDEPGRFFSRLVRVQGGNISVETLALPHGDRPRTYGIHFYSFSYCAFFSAHWVVAAVNGLHAALWLWLLAWFRRRAGKR